MGDMASQAEFPGTLPTNTYILQDYSEIAYIVCTGAIPANLDKTSDIQDATTRQPTLTRLKNAEQQFRQASILTILDAEKLELFTFYKKGDIVKDQKTILTKFGQVCKLNHCMISYKNACRITELLKPENARVFRLFTAAIISSIHIRPSNGKDPMKIGSQIYLLPSNDIIYDDWSSSGKPLSQWYLVRLDLQIISSGQMLLAVRPSTWPTLTDVAGLIDPDICPTKFVEGTPLLFVPTGYLARYSGRWTTEQAVVTHHWTESDMHDARWRTRFTSKVRTWLDEKHDVFLKNAPDTIWLEAQIPIRVSTSDTIETVRASEWRTVFWPATLTYAFTTPSATDLGSVSADGDPLHDASDWYLYGAGAAVASRGDRDDEYLQSGKYVNDRLFDDEGQFDSPQQYSGLPLHAFAHSQTVYPTPPEAPNAQATPGMSVDGTVQTPATIANLSNVLLHSSPVATMTDGGPGPATAQAISNFLDHNEDDDLFDDIDDEKMGPSSFADEPNWDFFNTDSIDIPNTDKPVEDDIPMSSDSAQPLEKESFDDISPSELRAVPDGAHSYRQSPITTADIAYGGQTEASPDAIQNQPGVNTTTVIQQPANLPNQATSQTMPPSTQVTAKRRRSSAYDVSPPSERNRDVKYSTRGKYYFASRLPDKSSVATSNLLSTGKTYASSNSSESVSDESINDLEGTPDDSRPWTKYNPEIGTAAAENEIEDNFDEDAANTEITELILLMQAAPSLEPFAVPISRISKYSEPVIQSPNRDSMGIQVLTEQLTQSCLLKDTIPLSIPGASKLPPFDVLADKSSSNAVLLNAQLVDLTGLQHPNMPVKSAARVSSLKHSKIRLRQADVEIAAELSMANFWEVLNLQPVSGNKDALALCLYPLSDNLKHGCDTFLQRMSETYSACNLGVLLRTALTGICEAGLAAWETTDHLYSLCQRIGEALAVQESEDCTIVFMVIPDDDLWRCRQLCDAFVELFEALERSRQDEFGDVVLQLVPSSFVVGKDTISVPEEQQFVNLALEVYNRLPPNLDSLEMSLWAPSTILHESDALSWHFELDAQRLSPLARHGRCCHLAYCVSLDQRWLVAAWSDTIGNVSMTMSYSLENSSGNSAHSRLDIFKHMCKATCETMNRYHEKWWLAIAKVGLYTTSELQDWFLATSKLTEQNQSLSRLILVSVELQPRLILPSVVPTARPGQPAPSQPGPNSLNTPVSTPQAVNTTSPEQSIPMTPTATLGWAMTAPTPPDLNTEAGVDAEVLLTDSTEDCWIATLPFGINQSLNLLETRQALASGMLLKRLTLLDNPASPLALLGVNLIYMPRKVSATTPNPPQDREQVLEEVLAEYKGLHTLALARNCVDGHSNCAPWHVATAYKGARILEQLL